MAEFGAPRTLESLGGTIYFNTRNAEEWFIRNTSGEDNVPVRAPIDNVPQGDGGIVHDFFDEPRHITVDGVIVLAPTGSQWSKIVRRNELEEELKAVCAAMKTADGTWSYTPSGGSVKQLVVRCDLQPTFPDLPEGKGFVFGLVAANPNWS